MPDNLIKIASLAGVSVIGVLSYLIKESIGKINNEYQGEAGPDAQRHPTNADPEGKPITYRVSCHWLPAKALEALVEPSDIVEFLRIYSIWDLPRLILSFAGYCEHPERVSPEEWVEKGRRDLFAYIHAGVCVGTVSDKKSNIVHFSDATRPVRIVQEPLQEVADGCIARVCNRFDTVYPPRATEKVIGRATLATGDDARRHFKGQERKLNYNLITNNCQHLSHWFRYDVAHSPEVVCVTKAFLWLVWSITLGTMVKDRERLTDLFQSLVGFIECIRQYTGYRTNAPDEKYREEGRFEPEYVCNCKDSEQSDVATPPAVVLVGDDDPPLQKEIISAEQLLQQFSEIVQNTLAICRALVADFQLQQIEMQNSQRQQHQNMESIMGRRSMLSNEDSIFMAPLQQQLPSSSSSANSSASDALDVFFKLLAELVLADTTPNDNGQQQFPSRIPDEMRSVVFCLQQVLANLDEWMRAVFPDAAPALLSSSETAALLQEIQMLTIDDGETENDNVEAEQGGNDDDAQRVN